MLVRIETIDATPVNSMTGINVVLIGEEAASMRTLHSLEQCGIRIVAVVASPRRRAALKSRAQTNGVWCGRDGICIPAREALKVGDWLADA